MSKEIRLNKAELIEKVTERVAGASKTTTGAYLNAIVAVIQETLKSGGAVAISGLGTFGVTKRAARTGRNPATGKPIQIAAKRVPKFSAGKHLRDLVK